MDKSGGDDDPASNNEEALELAAWMNEARSFLWQKVDPIIENTLKELERIDFLWGKIRLAKLTVLPNLKADVRIEGHLVVYANLELKFSKLLRTNGVSGQLEQYCVLNQILEFHGILQAQMLHLNSLRKFLAQQKPLVDDSQSNVELDLFLEIVASVYQGLRIVCHELMNAGNVLRLPSRRRFPLASHIENTFKPPFPPEIVVDFSIYHGELLLDVFSVGVSQRTCGNTSAMEIAANAASASGPPRKDLVGHICELRGHKVEIVEHSFLTIPIPQIEEMLTLLNHQITTLTRARENVHMLLRCHQ